MSDFIPADVVENRTDFGIFERAPQPGINYAAYPATCSAMRAQRNLGFHLSASFLCRKPQFNEPPEGLRPRRQVFLLPAPSVDALNHCRSRSFRSCRMAGIRLPDFLQWPATVALLAVSIYLLRQDVVRVLEGGPSANVALSRA